jgi:hypothetical protein
MNFSQKHYYYFTSSSYANRGEVFSLIKLNRVHRLNMHVYIIKAIILLVLLVAAVIETYNTCIIFGLKTNAYSYAYAVVTPNSSTASSSTTTNSTTALDYGIGKNAGHIAAVHDFSSLNGRSVYNPRTNQGSSNYRIGYSVGYNEEWKQLVSAANSSMSNSSTSYPSSSLSSSYQHVQRYLVNGTQSLNYTSTGQSLSCTDLNESSPRGAVLAATLNCGGGGADSAVNSHREGMPTTTHSLATPTTAPQLSMTNSCNNCGSKDNSIYKSGSSNGPSNDNEVSSSSSSSSSPLPGIIPPSP